MDEMSEGAPAPVEVLPDPELEDPDEPEPNGEDPLEDPPPKGEVVPPEEPDDPEEPDEPEALVALVVDPWTGQTTWPSPMPPTMATSSTTAASPATRPRRLGAGAGVYAGG